MKFAFIVFAVLCVIAQAKKEKEFALPKDIEIKVNISAPNQCQNKYPVVFLPGILGTILQVSSNIPSYIDIPRLCSRNIKNDRFWINLGKTFNFPCFRTYLRSNFSASRGTWSLTPGINFSVPDFGSTYAVDTLDPSGPMKYAIPYYHDMIKAFKKLGYVDGVSMAGAGYLWYQTPSDTWINNLKRLIERMYITNSFKPVILVAHSMGGPFSYYFMQKMGDDWVRGYIKKVIFAAPAFMGAVKAVEVMFNGIDGILPVVGKVLGPVARHVPTAWMLTPWADAFTDKDFIAISPHKAYKFNQLAELLKDVGMDYVDEKLLSTKGLVNKTINNYEKPLPVPVITHLGTNKETTKTLYFYSDLRRFDPDGDWPHADRYTCDGDGTVPLASARYPTDKWARKGAKVTTYVYKGEEHVDLLKNPNFINLVINEAC